MGGMIAVVILALLMVPVFFVSVQRVLAGDREKIAKPEAEAARPAGAGAAQLRGRFEIGCQAASSSSSNLASFKSCASNPSVNQS